MKIIQQQGGYIALITVLIIGAAATAIAIMLLITGTDSQRSALVSQQSVQARSLASSCAEEALQVVRDNKTYIGNGSLTLGAGSCTFAVASTGSSTRTIDVTGTVDDTVRKARLTITIGATAITVNTWQEVS